MRRNVIRIVQTYRTPADVTLTAPTLFYVGRAGQADGAAGRARQDDTRPVRRKGKRVEGPLPRHARRSASPPAWKGRFRYASCFPYNAGMGNPKLGCPKKSYKF